MSKRKSQNYRRFPLKEKEGEERHVSKLFYGKIQKKLSIMSFKLIVLIDMKVRIVNMISKNYNFDSSKMNKYDENISFLAVM